MLSVNDVFMERVFHIGRRIGHAEEAFAVRLILGEQELRAVLEIKEVVAAFGRRGCFQDVGIRGADVWLRGVIP
jgi:hypothetical protein